MANEAATVPDVSQGYRLLLVGQVVSVVPESEVRTKHGMEPALGVYVASGNPRYPQLVEGLSEQNVAALRGAEPGDTITVPCVAWLVRPEDRPAWLKFIVRVDG